MLIMKATTMKRHKQRIPLVGLSVFLLAMLAGTTIRSAEAQGYARTDVNQTYSERDGLGVQAELVTGDRDNGAVHVALPFDFSFFDRTYRHAWATTNGSIQFGDGDLLSASVADLALIAPAPLREAIHVLRSDLILDTVGPLKLTVHREDSDTRVVIQWRGVAFQSGERLVRLNMQAHLFDSGEILICYGPEDEVLPANLGFVSGVVNVDGSDVIAGFNGSALTQTTRPTANECVRFTPTGSGTADGVYLQPIGPGTDSLVNAVQGDTDVPVMGMRLAARGLGGTVSGLTVRHPIYINGTSIDIRLLVDNGTLGVVDGADTVLASGTILQGLSSTDLVFSPQMLSGGNSVRWLLVADLTSVDGANAGAFSVNVAAGELVTTMGTPYGGVITRPVTLARGPVLDVFASTGAQGRVARAGDQDVILASLELRREDAFGSTRFIGLQVTMILAGLANTDIDELRLYRDTGTTGALESTDTLLASATPPGAGATTLSGFSEFVPSDPDDALHILLVADIGSGITGTGFVGFDETLSSFGFDEPLSVQRTTGFADTVRVLGSSARLLLQRNDAAHLETLPAQPNDTNLPALAFQLQTSVGAGTVDQMTMSISTGTLTNVSASILWFDNGAEVGRFDSGDTQIAVGQINAVNGTILFDNLTSLSLSDAPTAFLVTISLDNGAGGASLRLRLLPSLVSSPTTVSGPSTGVLGTTFDVGAGVTSAGVDVDITYPRTAIDFGSDQIVPLAIVQVTPRAGGGQAPSIQFGLTDSSGGLTDTTLQLVPYLDANGSGGFDETDPAIIGREVSLVALSSVALSQGTTATVTAAPRTYVVTARRRVLHDGSGTIVFRGVTGGTNVRVTTLPSAEPLMIRTFNDEVDQGGFGGGGCAFGGDTRPLLALLLALILGLAAIRRRPATGAAHAYQSPHSHPSTHVPPRST